MVDLTKPLRFKDSKGRCYPVLGVVDEWNRQAIVVGNPWRHHFVPIASLENVPEPVVRYLAVRFLENSVLNFDYDARAKEMHKARGDALLKVTRTEDGKTRAEIIDD